MRSRRLGDTEWERRHRRIHELWHRDATLSEIAADLRVSHTVVGQTVTAMRRDGWDLPYRQRAVGAPRRVDRERILDLARAGSTTRDIIAATGTSQRTVSRVTREAGVAVEPLPQRQRRRLRTIALWHKGASMKEIATDLGVTERAVNSLITRLRREGIDLPYRRRRVLDRS